MPGGRGSNQYQSKPGIMPIDRRLAAAGLAGAVDGTDDMDAEEVAWAFHPERRNWDYFGIPADDQFDWQYRGFEPPAAAAWRAAGVRNGFEADEWSGAGFKAADAELWLRSVAVNTGFYGDTCPQYPWDHASRLKRFGFTATEIGEVAAHLWVPDMDRYNRLQGITLPAVSQAVPRTWRWAHVDANRAMEQAIRVVCEQTERGQHPTSADYRREVLGIARQVELDYDIAHGDRSLAHEFTRWFLQVSEPRLFPRSPKVE